MWIPYGGACAMALLVGCATARPVPIADPTQRLEFEGFSILPPRGENWFMAPPQLRKQLGPDVIVSFGKRLTPPSKTHTVTATVRGGRVPISAGSHAEALQKIAQTYSEQTGRYRPLSVNTSLDGTPAPDCVRYDATVEDRGVPGYPDSLFVLDMHGLVCLHPDLPDVAIDIQYSQRRLQEEQPVSLEAEGEPFVKSLMLNKFPIRSELTATRDDRGPSLWGGGADTTVATIPAGYSLGVAAESVVVGRVEIVRPDGQPLTPAPNLLVGRMGLTIESETDGKSYAISCDTRGFLSDFYVSLPAGRYRIVKWNSAAMSSQVQAWFEVGPRQVVYAGTLRFTGGGSIVDWASGGWTVVDASERTLRSFRERFPQLQQAVAKSLMWTAPER